MIVQETKPTEISAEHVTRLNVEVGAIRAELREIFALKAELENVKASEHWARTKLEGGPENIARADRHDRQAETRACRRKGESAQRDEVIAALKHDVDPMRTADADPAKALPARIAKIEEEVKKLR